MSHHHDVDRDSKPEGNFLTSRAGLALIGFLAVAGVLLFTEHRAHVLGVGLFLLLLACPLLHFFMHGGHDNHAGHDAGSPSQRESGRSNT